MQQNPSYERDLEYGYPYLSQSMVNSLPLNSPSILYNMGNDWVFPLISHSMGKCDKTNTMGDIDTHTHTQVMVSSVPLNSHPMELYIIWEMRGFSHQFLIAWENSAKPILWERPVK